MAYIYQPCYCTREQVMRALDVQLAAYASDKVDRACLAAVDAVEGLTQRKFYPQDGTRVFDYPNYQYSYPWRLWLDQNEMAAQPTLVVTGALLPTPVVIPTGSYIMQPVNSGPPFTHLELRRDANVGFGANTTPQSDIGLTGSFGYWTKVRAAGTITAAVQLGDTTVQVSDGVSIGVGDILIADSERMIVSDSAYVSTGISFSSGITQASAADNTGAVPSGAAFSIGETVLVDSEWMRIVNILGNNLVVKRGASGSVLATHSGGTIWARRILNVLRGQLGTATAAHAQNLAVNVSQVPGLVQQLAIAEAVVWLTGEPAAYPTGNARAGLSGSSVRASGSLNEPIPGPGLPDLREMVCSSRFTRKARSRAI